MKHIVFCVTVILLAIAPKDSSGAIVYNYVTDQSSYTGASTATVKVYLQETVSNGDSSLLAQTSGLYVYGFYVNQSAGPTAGQSTIASYATSPTFTGNYAADLGPGPSANSFEVTATVPNGTTTGPTGTVVSPGVRQILLGTLTVNTAAAATFTLQSLSNSPGNLGGSDGNTATLPASGSYDLDVTDNGGKSGAAGVQTYTGGDSSSYTFTVAAVPEPRPMLLTGLAAAVGLGVWVRRRRVGIASASAC